MSNVLDDFYLPLLEQEKHYLSKEYKLLKANKIDTAEFDGFEKDKNSGEITFTEGTEDQKKELYNEVLDFAAAIPKDLLISITRGGLNGFDFVKDLVAFGAYGNEQVPDDSIFKFIDERISDLNVSENSKDVINFSNNTFYLNKTKLCELRGFKFFFENKLITKKKEFFFQKILKTKILRLTQNIVDKFLKVNFREIKFDRLGNIFWMKSIIGKFKKGSEILNPQVELYIDYHFTIEQRQLLIRRLFEYLNFLKKTKLFFVSEIQNKLASFRAVAFALCENFGYCEKKKFGKYFANLSENEILFFRELGILKGTKFIYLKKIDCSFREFSMMLLNIYYKLDLGEMISRKFLIEKINWSFFNSSNQIKEKIGFCEIKVLRKVFLVHFSLYEKLISSNYFYKKNNLPISKNLKVYCDNNQFFLKNFFKNEKLFS